VGVQGGAEAIVQAVCHALVKLDMVNVFNTLRRDSILEAVTAEIPELLPM